MGRGSCRVGTSMPTILPPGSVHGAGGRLRPVLLGGRGGHPVPPQRRHHGGAAHVRHPLPALQHQPRPQRHRRPGTAAPPQRLGARGQVSAGAGSAAGRGASLHDCHCLSATPRLLCRPAASDNFYAMSYLYYGALGTLSTVGVGVLASYLTGEGSQAGRGAVLGGSQLGWGSARGVSSGAPPGRSRDAAPRAARRAVVGHREADVLGGPCQREEPFWSRPRHGEQGQQAPLYPGGAGGPPLLQDAAVCSEEAAHSRGPGRGRGRGDPAVTALLFPRFPRPPARSRGPGAARSPARRC